MMGGFVFLLLSAVALTESTDDVLRVQVNASARGAGVEGRTAALEQAKRDAVLDVVKGVSPLATEAGFRPLLNRAGQYIQSCRILDQKQLGEYTRVEIEAYVLYPALRQDLASYLLPLFPRTPRVTVAIADGLAEAGQQQFPGAESAVEELVQALVDAGLEVVDPAKVRSACSDVEYRTRVCSEPPTAVRFARENVADLAVVGEIRVVAEPAEAGSNLGGSRASLTLRLIRADDARLFDVLTSEAVVRSLNPKEAVPIAISDACAKLYEPMIVSSILAVAGARGSGDIILTLDGMSDRTKWADFCHDLQAQPGIEEIEELHFGGGTGRIRLKYDGPVAPLADLLTAGEVGAIRLEPKRIVERDMLLSVVE